MLCLFLFHIDYTIYMQIMFNKKKHLQSNKRYRTRYKM